MADDNKTVNGTEFSPSEAEEYVKLCMHINSLNYVTERTLDTSFIVSGLIGFVCHILTLFIHQRMSFSSSTLISYQSMTIIELFHMIVMAESGIFRWVRRRMGKMFTETDHTGMAVWLYQFNEGWHMGDAAKLSVSTISTFISLERMIAVCFPLALGKVKHNAMAYGAVLLSIVIGSAHFWPMLAVRIEYDPASHSYHIIDTGLQTSGFFRFLPNFIVAAKIFLSVTIFVSSVALIAKLKIESKKQMFWNVTAKSEWVARRRLCMFSIILGISILCDHAVWVAFKLMIGLIPGVSGSCDVTKTTGSFDEARWHLFRGEAITLLYFIQGFTGELVHCYRFFIHFAFNKAMREGFWKAIPKKKPKVGTVKTTRQ